jgi:hypothetical protein
MKNVYKILVGKLHENMLFVGPVAKRKIIFWAPLGGKEGQQLSELKVVGCLLACCILKRALEN